MVFQSRYRLLKSIAAYLCAAMLFSCQGRINEVREMGMQNFAPQMEETGMHLIYTDSGKVSVKLNSPKLLDYSNLDFPYRNFPKGVRVIFFDDDKQKNTVVADSAIIYEQTNLVDLRGHVKIVTGDSTVLNAQQLYWDRQRKWLFTDKEYTIKMSNGTVNEGKGFDANEKFNNFISRSNIGVHYLEEKDHE